MRKTWSGNNAERQFLRPPTFAGTPLRGQALGVRWPQCVTRAGGGGRPLAHKAAPDLVTATSGPATDPSQRRAAGAPAPPAPAPMTPSLLSSATTRATFPRGRADPSPDQRRLGDPGPSPERPCPPPRPPRAGAPRQKPAPRRATHLHSSGNSAPWVPAAPGAQTSSSSCSRSRERGGRPEGAGPRWALRPAAAPIAPGPGCAAGAELAARGCRGPRSGHGCAARAEAEAERSARSCSRAEAREARGLSGLSCGPGTGHVTAGRHRPLPRPAHMTRLFR